MDLNGQGRVETWVKEWKLGANDERALSLAAADLLRASKVRLQLLQESNLLWMCLSLLIAGQLHDRLSVSMLASSVNKAKGIRYTKWHCGFTAMS
jgi:hypothetical protein